MRKIFTLAAVALFTCTFVACGGPGKVNKADKETVQQQKPDTDNEKEIKAGDKGNDSVQMLE